MLLTLINNNKLLPSNLLEYSKLLGNKLYPCSLKKVNIVKHTTLSILCYCWFERRPVPEKVCLVGVMFLWVHCGQALLELDQAQSILLILSGGPVKPWHSECIPNTLGYYTAKSYGLIFLLKYFFLLFSLTACSRPCSRIYNW